jgi:cytidylate kinase
MNHIIIAIDGFSACGKSTTARAVASKLGYTYIDTGAMYRAVTLYFLQHYVSLTNPHDIEDALKKITVSFRKNPENGKDDVFLNGLNVEREARSMFVSEMVSQVSALHEVRVAMVAQQQKMGKKKGVVMDGRDIGTFVFPDAELKIFMMADMSLRAYRRQLELLEGNQMVPLHEIEENIRKRDMLDTSRKENPLIQAVDALVLDTTFLTIDEQVDYVVRLATSKIASPSL